MTDFAGMAEEARKHHKHPSSHGWEHVQRVYDLSLKLAEGKDVDLDVLKAAALLHDIARDLEDKGDIACHAKESANMAGPILKKFKFPEERLPLVLSCIEKHRFRAKNPPKTLEEKIVFDADKLDSLGATGIARLFMAIIEFKSNFYPTMPIEEYVRKNLGKNGRVKDNSLHSPYTEFNLKMKKIEDRVFTPEAKAMAKERTFYMQEFFDRLFKEREAKL